MKLSRIAGIWLCLCLIAGGCVSVEAQRQSATILMGFQPEGKGVQDLDSFKQDLIGVIHAGTGQGGATHGATYRLINLLTWKQACILYRTSTDERLRGYLIHRILFPGEHPFTYGIWTKEDILNLLGKPNQMKEEPADPESGGQLQQTAPNPEREVQIKELIRQLKGDEKSFWSAIPMIVWLDAKEAIPELINLLDDEDKCLTATRVLGTLGAKEAIPKIIKLLNHKHSEMRLAAAGALGNLGAKEAIPELMKLLNDEESQVRIVAACALDALGVKGVAIPELTKLLNDESILVRLSAACALGDLGARDIAIPELIKLLKITGERIPSGLYISAARALGKLNARESIPELIKLLTDDRWEVRQAASDALSELDDIEAIPELTNQPIDYDSLWACKRALAINPKDISAYFNMGFIYDARLDNPSRAISCYQKYLELAPSDAPDRKRVERWIEGCNKRIQRLKK